MSEKVYHVTNLTDAVSPSESLQGGAGPARVAEVDETKLQQVLGAPWRSVQLIQLDPGSSLGPRELGDTEVVVHVVSGAGIARFEVGDEELSPEKSLAYLMGETIHIENGGEEPLEIFTAEMSINPS